MNGDNWVYDRKKPNWKKRIKNLEDDLYSHLKIYHSAWDRERIERLEAKSMLCIVKDKDSFFYVPIKTIVQQLLDRLNLYVDQEPAQEEKFILKKVDVENEQ